MTNPFADAIEIQKPRLKGGTPMPLGKPLGHISVLSVRCARGSINGTNNSSTPGKPRKYVEIIRNLAEAWRAKGRV